MGQKSNRFLSNNFPVAKTTKRKETKYGPRKGSRPAGRISNRKGI